MIIILAVIFIFSFLFKRWLGTYGIWIGLSVVVLLQVSQKSLWAILGFLLINPLVKRFSNIRFFHLLYSVFFIGLNQALNWNIPGFSYLTLSSSRDLAGANLKGRALNLLSFAKVTVGPISAAREHAPVHIDIDRIAFTGIKGFAKGFIFVNIWRLVFQQPVWSELYSPSGYFWFGLWNYVNLYLEFSGICDLVVACFWIFGFNCPINFNRPYFACTVTDFWNRWHITLGAWIRDFVYIPLGGSRGPKISNYINLLLAMLVSGLWHGLTLNYALWGLLQGILLSIERAFVHKERSHLASSGMKVGYWIITQFFVIVSWIIFFMPT